MIGWPHMPHSKTIVGTHVRVLFLAAVVCACGCARGVAWLDRRDSEDSLMQRAHAQALQGNTEAAIRLYTEALETKPDLARAHLDVALILHDQRKDYVRAIYHYTRYLERRPDSEKRDMILNRIRLAKQAFAASLINAEKYGADDVVKLQAENEKLQREKLALERDLKLMETRARSAEERLSQVLARNAVVSSPPGQTPAAERTHTVQRGENLSSIAMRYYGDADKWREIKEANKDKIKGDRVLPGQVLVLP